jgi:hypothetical protein
MLELIRMSVIPASVIGLADLLTGNALSPSAQQQMREFRKPMRLNVRAQYQAVRIRVGLRALNGPFDQTEIDDRCRRIKIIHVHRNLS